MKFTNCTLALALLCTPVLAIGAALTCASDSNTDKHMCFADKGMKRSTDGEVREFALYVGGPRGASATGHTARIFCSKQYVPVMELRDNRGVVYAREQAVTQVGRDLSSRACSHMPARIDKALDKVKRL